MGRLTTDDQSGGAGAMAGTPYAELLAQAREVAEHYLAPCANEVDQADRVPVENLERLAAAGLLGLTTPVAYGGHGAPPETVRALMEILAAACGVTIFVAFQHLVACRHLAGGENEALKTKLLPRLARGERLASLAFSHLRRPGPPLLRVERDGPVSVLNGTAPWATGWGVAHEVLIAGVLPDGRSVWFLVPLAESKMLRASPPMRLCAMNASATVSLTCHNLWVGPERYVKTMTPEELRADTSHAVLFFTSLSLGAATAAMRIVRDRANERKNATMMAAADALERETADARREVALVAARAAAPDYPEATLQVRARCIELGVRAAHSAVTVSSGAANQLDHAAQRIFREAMVYTTTALTGDLQAAVLERLMTRG
jgi:alkylation response protein AidB-like acyl-CoA dehydrogenase